MYSWPNEVANENGKINVTVQNSVYWKIFLALFIMELPMSGGTMTQPSLHIWVAPACHAELSFKKVQIIILQAIHCNETVVKAMVREETG